ncbi:hypothetical protein ACFY1P_04490 [Streptomyces sp. NPDC001407]|uniref:hypothetical protein n=1 Tax=Streptomyces sp. NPDC001407 TaxID=3364573 RepID=UPI0036A8394B
MNRSPGPPPWLWPVTVLYATQVPAAIGWWTAQVRDLTGHGAYSAQIAATWGIRVLLITSVVQVLPQACVVVGVLGVLLPWVRRWLVERHYGLLPPEEVGTGSGIQRFVAERAPGVETRISLRRGQPARVYLDGRRGTRIAVFGPLFTLWDEDRLAAEAMLLHELAHHRSGEQHVAGLGSPLTGMLRAWPWIFGLCGLLPAALLLVVGEPTGHELLAQVVFVILRVPHFLILPLGALWTAELVADRYARATAGQDAVLRALHRIGEGARHRGLRLHHPSVRLRRWCVLRADERRVQFVLASLLPAAVLAGTLLDIAGVTVEYRLLAKDWGWSLRRALWLAHDQLAGGPLWAVLLAVFAVWPLLARAWSRLWGWREERKDAFSVRAYVAAALVPVLVLAVGLIPATAPPLP